MTSLNLGGRGCQAEGFLSIGKGISVLVNSAPVVQVQLPTCAFRVDKDAGLVSNTAFSGKFESMGTVGATREVYAPQSP